MSRQGPVLFEAPLAHKWATRDGEVVVGSHPQVNTPLPQSGPGFVSSKPQKRQFGLPATIRAIQAIAATWQQAHPNGPRLGIRDISFQGGGPMDGHKSHQLGVDVDIRPVRNDGQEDATTFRSPTYSRALTQELVHIIRANSILKVQFIFFNDKKIKGVQPWPNHDDHLHIRFFPPSGTPIIRPSPRPLSPSSPSTPPTLITSENQPPDNTLYVKIPLGSEGGARPMTGIFIPRGYRPQPQVDILLYLHGYKASAKQPDPKWSVDWYWHNLPLRAFREELNESRKNVVLVTPTLGKYSEAGWLEGPGGLDRYLNAIIAALKAHGPYQEKEATVGNIILASHSGGGLAMRRLALSNQQYSPLVCECWGFDSMYNYNFKHKGGEALLWQNWATQNPNAKLFNYYTHGTKTAGQSLALQRLNLPNVSILPLKQQPCLHDWIPILFWRTRIEQATFLLNL